MATALSVITRAMRLARVIGKGEALDADEAADGLVALNALLDAWNTQRLYAYYIANESLSLVAGTTSYTMGVGGNLNTTRPSHIATGCYLTYNGYDLPLQVVDYQQYDSVVAKAIQSNIPSYLFADMRNPLVYLYFYPTPAASATAHILSWKQLSAFTALTDSVALPPGYENALTYSLAEDFGPEFGVSIQPMVIKKAQDYRAAVKRNNTPAPLMMSEAGYMNRMRPAGNIYTG
jgi:hypothetical protein